MVAKKRKSKRQTLQQKFRVIKRTKEHHKRLKKGKNVSINGKKKPENRIPNAWPYKEEVLLTFYHLHIIHIAHADVSSVTERDSRCKREDGGSEAASEREAEGGTGNDESYLEYLL